MNELDIALEALDNNIDKIMIAQEAFFKNPLKKSPQIEVESLEEFNKIYNSLYPRIKNLAYSIVNYVEQAFHILFQNSYIGVSHTFNVQNPGKVQDLTRVNIDSSCMIRAFNLKTKEKISIPIGPQSKIFEMLNHKNIGFDYADRLNELIPLLAYLILLYPKKEKRINNIILNVGIDHKSLQSFTMHEDIFLEDATEKSKEKTEKYYLINQKKSLK